MKKVYTIYLEDWGAEGHVFTNEDEAKKYVKLLNLSFGEDAYYYLEHSEFSTAEEALKYSKAHYIFTLKTAIERLTDEVEIKLNKHTIYTSLYSLEKAFQSNEAFEEWYKENKGVWQADLEADKNEIAKAYIKTLKTIKKLEDKLNEIKNQTEDQTEENV